MSRFSAVRPWRWLGIFVFMLLLVPPATAAAQDEGGGECTEASTPNLVITAVNAGQNIPRLTLTVQTNKVQTGPYVNGHWNVIFRAKVNGTNYVLDNWEIHRVFLKGHEGEENVAATQDEGCGDEGGCGGDDEAGMIGAGIRGIGYVNGVKMRFQIDLKDFGNNPDKPDLIRVRWRTYVEGDSGHDDSGSCEGDEGGWTNNTWFPVLQINIHQR